MTVTSAASDESEETENRAGSGPDDDRGSIFEGVGRHALVYAVGIIVARSVSFLLLPVYTRYLTPGDYGVMALIEMALDFIQIVAGAQLAAGVFRFYHKADTDGERRRVVSTSFLLVSGMYAVVGVGTFLAARPLAILIFESPANTLLIRVATANMAMGALLIIPLSFARVEDRSKLFVGATLTKALLGAALNVFFLVVMGLGVMAVFLSSLISNTLVGVAMSIWLLRRVRLAWPPAVARHLLRYGAPLMATSLATFATTFSDRFFLQAAANPTVVGLYDLAYQFGFILVVLAFSPVDQIWGPRRFRAAKQADKDDVLSRGFILMNVVLITAAVCIALFVFDLLRIMATPDFLPAAQVVPLILIAYVLQCWASVQDIGILVSERTEYVTLANFLAAAVAVTGYILLVPLYFEWGAAITTVAAFLARYIFTYRFAQKLWRVEYRWRPVVILVVWATVVSVVGALLPEAGIVQSVAMRSALLVTFLGVGWLLPILDDRDRAAARRALSRFHQTIRQSLSFSRQPH